MQFDNLIILLKFVQLVMNSNLMNLMADYCYLWMELLMRDQLMVVKATMEVNVHKQLKDFYNMDRMDSIEMVAYVYCCLMTDLY